MLQKIIQDYLVNRAEVDIRKFDNPNLTVAELGLDSLGVVEMLFEVEDLYGFQIEDPMRYSKMKFVDMIADMEATIRAKHNGELPPLIEK